MASIPSFIFGAGTKYKTQEELERAREQVKALLEDTTQYTGWGGVLENLGEGIAARVEKGRIGEGQEFLTGEQSKLWDMFGGGGGYGGGEGSDTLTGGGGTDTLTGKGNGDYRSAIAGIESGGRYDAVGPTHPKMGRALGKYQIMESNIGPWSREVLGREVSASEFMANPQLQDAIFDGKFGSYVQQYGPEGAAQAWIGGPGGVGKTGRKDVLGTSIGEYGRRFTKALGGGGDQLSGDSGSNTQAGGGKNDVALAGVDPYGALPAIDTLGQDQRAKFRDWNSDPVGNEASILKGVDPALAGVIQRAKQIAGTNFVVASGQRTPEMQKKAKDFGWSKTLDSDHLGGGASDLWPVDEKGQVVFDKGRQAKIVDAMKQAAQEMGVDLEAGADWKSPDRPHFGMVGQTPMDAPVPAFRPPQAPAPDPMVTGSTTPPPQPGTAFRNAPITDVGLRTPAGQDFLSRMGSPVPMANQQLPMVSANPQRRMVNPASMSGGAQPLPMVPGRSGGPMPSLQQPVPPPQPPQPVPAPPPAPAPAPPAPPQQVDPFTDMILGDKAAQFKPGNYIPPAPVGKQVFPAAPPAPGTPAAAGFGVPPVVGGGGADQLAGKGTFPPAPAPPQAQAAGGGNKIAKLQFILASPYASKEQKLMAASMIEREYALEDERRKAASPEAQLDLQYKRAQIDEIKRKQTEDPSLINLGDGVLYDPKTRKVVYDQSQQGGPKAPDFDDTSGVRKEITALPSYKNLAQASPIWSSVVSAADRKTTQADLNIILGIAKIMDPTSVVRTEEGESVRDTGGASTELSKWFSYLKSNSDAVLDDGIRERLLNEGYSRVKGYEDEYAADTEFYGQFADRKKIDRADIIRAFPPARQWKPGNAPDTKKKADKYGVPAPGGGR